MYTKGFINLFTGVGLAKDPDIYILPLSREPLSPEKADTLFPKADFYCINLGVFVECFVLEDSQS